MKPQKSAVQLLIVLEVIALIAALIFGILHGGRAAVQSNNYVPSAPQDNLINTGTEGTEEDQTVIVQNTLEPVVFSEEVAAKLESMTLEEKVAQMFFITPEALTHNDVVSVAGNGTRDALDTYPVGGLIYSAKNFQGQQQTRSMLSGVQGYINDRIGLQMFLGIEETGGEEHSPLASSNAFPVQASPAELAESGDIEGAVQAADAIGRYLAEQGFNLNFAPSAELADGTGADDSAYGSDASLAAQMVEGSINAYHTNNIATAAGSFPGNGDGTGDDLQPFEAAVRNNSDFIVLGNNACEAITGDAAKPCSLSGNAVYYLRNDLGYQGILITDNLSEAAITENFSSAEAAVEAVKAGVNMLYCPQDFEEAYSAIIDAVENGEIDAETIDQAAGYILTQKLAMPNGGQE